MDAVRMPNNRTRVAHQARKCRNDFNIMSGSLQCGQDICGHAIFHLQRGGSIPPGTSQ